MKRRTRSERKAPERLPTGQIGGIERYHGPGIVLGTSKIISDAISGASNEILVLIHRLMYQRQGSQKERLNNILSFCGFENDDQVEKCKVALLKRNDEEVKTLAELFKLEDTQRDEIIDGLAEFLKEPKRPREDVVIEFIDEEQNELEEREKEEKELELEMEEEDDDQEVYDENEDDALEEDEDIFEDSELENDHESESEEEEEEEEEEDADLDNVFDEIEEKKPRTKKTESKDNKKKKNAKKDKN
ncbi:hypothetical protein EHI8A_037390 [Entamoeba histolytica HM-1:IMSS-B]|uniref:Uncharacterized protein n=6 Tax=Entamoeba histolytica TaxID=5759 RepID=C4M4W6_ENTH1|nr:hypothetical protein EHI_029090 [Entamoeba histolytica HM-1:IMSS]EMD43283.1 Hypothetical protein EHI5A_063820 [Entamoeba histolytica KU27]EMH74992.1 hypothetical protein EHI8A_037390 [Entamoeba histolytica HM-1:IMSS-B]EMS13161.1 hypothetical protein KM1_076420 [Entamoeba histolytica HM-3:IMSS]ENY60287.1 hypothetical protein EHI7A_040900 [Entamoeba histolytica HM-1:IMSS-A]GAT96436.1 hypothetical protein CL6EHI_029090 [Entamoeba histolytica]|eukprot:XP_652653.1 hypothetical protein EHI_029090 [Entamoeba histolytica HM-1:IMSS]